MMVVCTQVNKMYVIATLSVYPHRASLKNMPGRGGIPPRPGIFFKLARCGHTLRVAITYIVLYTLKDFNNIYILQNYLSCHALKIKSTQIIFKQETHLNIIRTLTIHKQTRLNFDGKKYILAQTHSISITVLHNNHPC